MKRTKTRALFKSIENGNVPKALTAQRLGEIQDDSGRTALHVCAESGHYPDDITNADLAAALTNEECPLSALHVAAAEGTLLPGTTAKELASCADFNGFTALRMAAMRGHLPEDTTAQDLLADVINDGSGNLINALECMADTNDQIPMVLKHTTSSSGEEMKKIAETLKKKNPAAVGLWVQAEIENGLLAKLRRTPTIP
jgi:ankyrin repeat protein